MEYFNKTQLIDSPKTVNILILNVQSIDLSHLQKNATFLKHFLAFCG